MKYYQISNLYYFLILFCAAITVNAEPVAQTSQLQPQASSLRRVEFSFTGNPNLLSRFVEGALQHKISGFVANYSNPIILTIYEHGRSAQELKVIDTCIRRVETAIQSSPAYRLNIVGLVDSSFPSNGILKGIESCSLGRAVVTGPAR